MRGPAHLWVFALAAFGCVRPATTSSNHHPLEVSDLVVIDALREQRRLEAEDPRKQLVDVAEVPGIVLDLRYATDKNFMGEVLYPVGAAYLRAPAAAALAQIAQELAAQGLAIKVFDAYRPYRVTVRMWERIGDPDYVADPAKGSRHNRGAAVDVTLVRLVDGEELAMPTPYDDFTVRAHHTFVDLEPEALANRALLREVMERHGFAALPTEWWHYDFAGWQEFELLDLEFRDVERLSN